MRKSSTDMNIFGKALYVHIFTISHSADYYLNKCIHIKLNLDIHCIEWVKLKKKYYAYNFFL